MHKAAFAFAAGIARTAGDDHAELRGNDIQPLTELFADDVALMAAGTCCAVWLDDLFNAWQMFGQSTTRLAFG